MISKYDFKKHVIRLIEEGKLNFVYNESDDSLYDKDGQFVCLLDEYLDLYRRKTGQHFTSIYTDPCSLLDIIKCNECGTVIFSSDNYEEYDQNLCCPTCVGYKTHFKFWTKEEIENDEEKQKTIEFYEQWTREKNERYEREQRRGKLDWEITKNKIKTKSYMIEFILECDNITKSYFKDLRFVIQIWKKDNEDSWGYHFKKKILIPLSWSQFYIHYIYIHLGKCHPSVRSKWYIGKAKELTDDVHNHK